MLFMSLDCLIGICEFLEYLDGGFPKVQHSKITHKLPGRAGVTLLIFQFRALSLNCHLVITCGI